MKTLIRVFSFIVGVVILVANPNMFLFICFAMAPAIVSLMLDRLPGKNTSTTVLLFNLSGVSIFVFQVLSGNRSISKLSDAFNIHWILVVYLFAALGWFIIWLCPKLVTSLSEFRYEKKIQGLEKKIAQLADEWGEEVKG